MMRSAFPPNLDLSFTTHMVSKQAPQKGSPQYGNLWRIVHLRHQVSSCNFMLYGTDVACHVVTSHNTPVTMLTNFWLVPGHAVTSFIFRDSRNLGFALELGCKAPNTTRPDIIITPGHSQFFCITEDSYPQP